MTHPQLLAEKKCLRDALKLYEARFEEKFKKRPRDADKRRDAIDDLYVLYVDSCRVHIVCRCRSFRNQLFQFSLSQNLPVNICVRDFA